MAHDPKDFLLTGRVSVADERAKRSVKYWASAEGRREYFTGATPPNPDGDHNLFGSQDLCSLYEPVMGSLLAIG